MEVEIKTSNQKNSEKFLEMKKKFLLLSIVGLFIGANVLIHIGYMDTNEFSFLRKMFPVSYLMIFVFLINYSIIPRFKDEVRFIVLFIILVLFNMSTGREIDLAASFNSVILPVFFSIQLFSMKVDKAIIKKILISCYLLECSIAIIERITMHNFFYLLPGGGDASLNDGLFRSTALLAHPLENALTVSVIMSFILVSNMRVLKKMQLWGIGFVSLLCFNTRFAIICSAVCLGWYSLYFLFSSRIENKKSKKYFVLILLLMVFGIFKLFTSYGLGSRLLEMGAFDESSAGVRLIILSIFDYYPVYSVLLGVPLDIFERYLAKAHLTGYIIENYWIIYLFRFGLIFLLLIVWFYIPIIKKWLLPFDKCACMMVLFIFLFISSSNNSMAASSLSLSVFAVSAYAFSDDRITEKRML